MNQFFSLYKQRLKAGCILFLLICFLFGFDVFTKLLAVKYLKGQNDIIILPGVLQLHYLENSGAAFGILKGQFVFFFILTIAVCVGIVIFLLRLPLQIHSLYYALPCVLLLSGALGNLKDRILQQYVVDFIYFSWINFPVFNVADIYVTISIPLIAVALYVDEKE